MDMFFNIRVYGIYISDGNVLLSDEWYKGISMTKFPGGGLEFGEGTHECLIREIKEEVGCESEIIDHFYTTDFFQPARFFKDTQLISIYYRVKIHGLPKIPVSSKKQLATEGNPHLLRWVPLKHLTENQLTFPIDRLVANKLLMAFL